MSVTSEILNISEGKESTIKEIASLINVLNETNKKGVYTVQKLVFLTSKANSEKYSFSDEEKAELYIFHEQFKKIYEFMTDKSFESCSSQN